MKKNLTIWLSLIGAVIFAISVPQQCRAVSACLSARFNDYKDLGCHLTPGGFGSLPSPTAGPGGNQAVCMNCGGMPRWWVSEPYINLWAADEPLSYTTSSGQHMTFRWTYKQRAHLDLPVEHEEAASVVWNQYHALSPHVMMRYTSDTVPAYFNTNGVEVVQHGSSWQHNWWQEITFWDPYIETNSFCTGVTYQPNFAGATNAFIQYTANYLGLLFRGDGGVIPFDSSNQSSPTSGGQVRVQLLGPGATAGGPQVPYPYHTTQPYPKNGAFFVTNAQYGFAVSYPDGSEDIYGLVLFHNDVSTQCNVNVYGPPPKLPRSSPCSAYMTERIDPQGRVALVGYEPKFEIVSGTTNFAGYDVKYVVDSDGRTNTYAYTNYNAGGGVIDTGLLLASITDPYGRTAQFSTTWPYGITAITDAQDLTSHFWYDKTTNNIGSVSNAWLTKMITPYCTNSFSYYELQESGATNEYEQRATLVTEADSSNQLFCYIHNSSNGLTSSVPTNQVPSVPGYPFDTGNVGGSHPGLNYRNTFHWDERQFSALSSTLQSSLESSLSGGLSSLALHDFQKARLKHWLLDGSDGISLTDCISSEVDPSPDAAGTLVGNRTWYDYPGKDPSNPQQAGGPLIGCVAQLLPEGTSRYVSVDYGSYPYIGFPQDRWESYSLPNGTVAVLTTSFNYAGNGIDLLSVSNSAGQQMNFVYNAHHEAIFITNALNQVAKLAWDSNTFNLTNILLFSGKKIGFIYYPATAATNNAALLEQIVIQPENLTITIADYTNGLPFIVHQSGTGIADLWVTNAWDGLNRLTGTTFDDNTTVSNIYTFLDLSAHKDRLNQWSYFGYDALQHLTTITNANNKVTTLTWCGCGALTEIIDVGSPGTELEFAL